jgi:hypothetical protein
LFFRELHGAEEKLFFGIRIFARWFRRALDRRLFAARSRFTLVAAGFVAARAARRRRHLARRLDAAERAAEFVNLALIRELLAFGDFDEFKHLVKLVNHLLERPGDLRGVGDGLADGRGFGGAEISGPDPWFRTRRLALRFGAALFRAAVALFHAQRFRPCCGRGFFGVFGVSCGRLGFMRGKFGGRFRVRLAKTAGLGLVFRFVRLQRHGGRGGGFNGFGSGRNFFASRHTRF